VYEYLHLYCVTEKISTILGSVSPSKGLFCSEVRFTIILYLYLFIKCDNQTVIFLTTGRMESANRISYWRKGQ
jgi:hypothetical protein